VSVTLSAYMSAMGPASRSVASLMLEGDPFPEAAPVIPIVFPCLACACRPSLHHGEVRRILPAAKFSWLLPPKSENPPSIFVARLRERRAQGSQTSSRSARRHTLGRVASATDGQCPVPVESWSSAERRVVGRDMG
jgi:hypothetical protein